jgi:hypothetical protein
MSLYQYLLKMKQISTNTIQKIENQHSAYVFAKKIKSVEREKIEVRNKIELNRAIQARRFYRLAF